MNQERSVLYINILIHDASEAIKSQVAAKVKKSRIPGPLKESVANRAAARVTWDSVTASKVVDKLGPRLCQEIPIKMSKKGIQVRVENVFTEGNYIVLELQVQHVDAIVMTEAKHKTEENVGGWSFTSGLFKSFYILIGVDNRDSLEREVLPNIVQRKVSVSIREMLKEKLTEKKMTADLEILHEDKQARYFFTTLKGVREAANENTESPKKGPSNTATTAPSNKSTTTNPAKHVRAGSLPSLAAGSPPVSHVRTGSHSSLSSFMEAATSAVAAERVKNGPVPDPVTNKKVSEVTPAANKQSTKKAPRSSKLAAAVSVVSTVKKGGSVPSTGRVQKVKTACAAPKRSAIF